MKASIFWSLILTSIAPFVVSVGMAEVPREKREQLASVLETSFSEQARDHRDFQDNQYGTSDQQARQDIKAIHIEIGDNLAGPGRLVRSNAD